MRRCLPTRELDPFLVHHDPGCRAPPSTHCLLPVQHAILLKIGFASLTRALSRAIRFQVGPKQQKKMVSFLAYCRSRMKTITFLSTFTAQVASQLAARHEENVSFPACCRARMKTITVLSTFTAQLSSQIAVHPEKRLFPQSLQVPDEDHHSSSTLIA